ncbi:MAG: MBL fold metallo-hydrolase [Desulfobacteraceae bacterium]|nr:MBL fold metallo-hydrolase [Desulfobacteraceae bacterium]
MGEKDSFRSGTTYQALMTRRHLIKKLLSWSKMALMLSFFPSCSVFKPANAEGNTNRAPAQTHGLSLREIARKKIHHGNDRFISPFGAGGHKNPWQILRWKLFSENRFKAYYERERVIPVSIDWGPVRSNKGLSITFIKHAGMMIKDVDKYILVDPIFFDLSWFIKDFTPLASDIKEMPTPDHVLITHGHYDHLDKTSLGVLDKETHLITPLGYNDVFDDLGMNRRTQLDWFDAFKEGERRIALLPCNHWTMRNLLVGPNRSLWGSFLLKTKSGATIFISGDTGYFEGFREIGEEFSIDLAIFNLSAYEPRWFMAASHINPRETVRAFRELRAKHLLIVHWGTFRLGDEPVYFPPVQLKQELAKEGLSDRLLELDHGRTLSYERERCGA